MSNVSAHTDVAETEIGREAVAEDFADLYDLNTEFGRLAAAARAEYFRAGGKPSDQEGIEREVAERRSGTFTRP